MQAAKANITETILESISDGVFTIDTDWRIRYFNKAAERITGLSRAEAIGNFCYEVLKSNMCEADCPIRQTMKTGQALIDKKGFCVTPSGERVPISVSTALLVAADGKVIGAAETFRDLRELEELKEKLYEQTAISDIASHNPKMRRLLELLPMIAESNASVLITGETGTGKEVIARSIHRLSDRAKGPFIAVNCGALPDSLLESELFGYKKGAFTGADKDKAGRFKRAHNGSLFLDEIGDISPALQIKLLRVLQEREYEALGATTSERTNARIITATNRDLAALTEAGSFRQDLYYRIKVINLVLPPLRERKEDIAQLAEIFLRRHTREAGKRIRGFSKAVLAAFEDYQWPGNIRELENVVERATALCSHGLIDLDLLPSEILDTGSRKLTKTEEASESELLINLRAEKQDYERKLIINALSRSGYQVTAAAHQLGIDKATMYRKISQLDINLKALRSLGNKD